MFGKRVHSCILTAEKKPRGSIIIFAASVAARVPDEDDVKVEINGT